MAARRRSKTLGTVTATYGGVGNNSRVPGFPGQIVPPPPGTYDPVLDAQLGQTQRGYGDTQADYVRDYGATGAGGRRFDDYTLAQQDITRQVQEGRQDYATRIGGIQRDYTRLGRRQGEGARHSGVTSAGLLGVARAKRAQNLAFDRAPVDTAAERLFGTDPNLVGGALGRASGNLALGYGRDVADAGTGLTRAGRENSQFAVDTQAARLFQAANAANPYNPPTAADLTKPQRLKDRRTNRSRARGGLTGTVRSSAGYLAPRASGGLRYG